MGTWHAKSWLSCSLPVSHSKQTPAALTSQNQAVQAKAGSIPFEDKLSVGRRRQAQAEVKGVDWKEEA